MVVLSGCSSAPERTRLVLAATTSLEDTGLLDYLAAEFKQAHAEIDLAPVAVGTGQAIALGRRGDADILISHDSAAEMQLVQEGIARMRRSVMYNDFVIVGPPNDPAGARGTDAIRAFTVIAKRSAPFVSRGDDSGTHRRELSLWRDAKIDPRSNTQYIEAGLGMGDALLLAGQKQAYILTDRATFRRFAGRVPLEVIVSGDPPLYNRYGVTVLKGPREAAARQFADWITSDSIQRRIGEFGKAEFGVSLFEPAHGAALHDTIPTGERSE